MRIPQRLPTIERKGRRGPACILDLPPDDVVRREVRDARVVKLRSVTPGLVHGRIPYTRLGVGREAVEVQGDVDARGEGRVEGRDVGRREGEVPR